MNPVARKPVQARGGGGGGGTLSSETTHGFEVPTEIENKSDHTIREAINRLCVCAD